MLRIGGIDQRSVVVLYNRVLGSVPRVRPGIANENSGRCVIKLGGDGNIELTGILVKQEARPL